MKKLFFISALLLTISFACQKEVIRPNDTMDIFQLHEETPEYKHSGGMTSADIDDTDSNDITDPNNDPDINKKKNKKD